eukprot:4120437-Prymnesium_polylepis.1
MVWRASAQHRARHWACAAHRVRHRALHLGVCGARAAVRVERQLDTLCGAASVAVAARAQLRLGRRKSAALAPHKVRGEGGKEGIAGRRQ